jgi:hypothetical protein
MSNAVLAKYRCEYNPVLSFDDKKQYRLAIKISLEHLARAINCSTGEYINFFLMHLLTLTLDIHVEYPYIVL